MRVGERRGDYLNVTSGVESSLSIDLCLRAMKSVNDESASSASFSSRHNLP